MDDPDLFPLERLRPALGRQSSWPLWVEGFAHLTCVEAGPTRTPVESFGPSDVIDVWEAHSDWAAGVGWALFRLFDGSWAVMEVRADHTAGHLRIRHSTGIVGPTLNDVLAQGSDALSPDRLGIPKALEYLREWAWFIERGVRLSRSDVLHMLGDHDVWREVIDTMDALHAQQGDRGSIPYVTYEINGVVAAGTRLPEPDEPGWAAAVLRVNGLWGSLESTLISSDDPAGFTVELGRRQVSSSLAQVAWWGIAPERRQALGLPTSENAFRAWAAFAAAWYPGTAHRSRFQS